MNKRDMKLQQLYNTAREQQQVQQEYSNYIRYSLLILTINTVVIKRHCNKVATDFLHFFFLKEFIKNVAIQATHTVPDVKCLQLHGEGAYTLPWSFKNSGRAGLFCVHGKRLKLIIK